MSKATCKWEYDEFHDYWDTECSHTYSITDGTLKDNGFKYCPYCSKEIEEQK